MKKTIFIHLFWAGLLTAFICAGFKSRKFDATPKSFSGGMFFYVNPGLELNGIVVEVDSAKMHKVKFKISYKDAYTGEAELSPVKFFLVKVKRKVRLVIPITGSDDTDIAYNFTGEQEESIRQYVNGAIGGDSIKIEMEPPAVFMSNEMLNSLKK